MSIQVTNLYHASIRPSAECIYHIQEGKPMSLSPIGLAKDHRFDTHPTLTPDGTNYIFSRVIEGASRLILRSIESGNEKRLTDSNHFEDFASFDTAGNLYFLSDYDGLTHIWKAAFSEHGVKMADAKKVTSGAGSHFSFALSPEGTHIVFSSNRENLGDYPGPQPSTTYQAGRLYIMEIDHPQTAQPLIDNARFLHTPWWEGTPLFSPDGQYIFYYSTENKNPQLMRYDRKTHSTMALTPPEEKALYPSLTRNNQLIFSSQNQQGHTWNIQTMDFSGSHRRTLIQDPQQSYWAPKELTNGSYLCYGSVYSGESLHGEGNFHVDRFDKKGFTISSVRGLFPVVSKTHIFCIEAMKEIVQYLKDGSERQVFYRAERAVFGLSGSLSGSLVAAIGTPFSGGASDIILLNNRAVKVLTSNVPPACNVWPSITADGATIIFSRQLSGQRKHLYAIDREGINLTQLTSEATEDHTMPSISLCGRKIVYCASKDRKTYQICYLLLDETRTKVVSVAKLTCGYADTHPVFSADGTEVIFSSNRGGHKREVPLNFFFNPQPYGDLFSLHLETKEIRQLTHTPFEDSTPHIEIQ